MEDFRFDLIIGEGTYARQMKIALPPFTLIGATTRTGLLTSPLRDRFGISSRLTYYNAAELEEIIRRSARIMELSLETEGAKAIARRARGTPRVANRLLRRVRDFAQVEGTGVIDAAIADYALGRMQVDALGLDPMDRLFLRTLIEKFAGGPAGIETLSAAIGEEKHTLEDVYEPFLIQEGFLQRTPRGRVAARRAYEHLGLTPPKGMQGHLI
jgi:Holliday junction DNA helicase RuvB